MEPAFFQAQGRADLGQINDEGRVLLCTEGTAIFDSLVADLPPTPRLWRPGVFGQIRDGKAKSANIELCVIASSREA